ncbi:MAG: Gfo/Idh/MocA family protein, partial [Bryobacteraceae bacterium]
QKPMAPTWAEATAMVNAAERSGIPLMIHENWRWQPWYRQAKNVIEAGEIGHPLNYLFRITKRDGLGSSPYPDQPYFRQMPRLLIYETIVHHIDTARFLFGEIASVYAQARKINQAIAGEDQALLLLTHQSGLIGSIQGHRYLDTIPPGPVLGDAFFDGDRARLTVLPTGDLLVGPQVRWSNDVTTGYRGDSVLATQQHFIDCLKTGQTFESASREYLRTVAVVEAAYQSIAQRRPVELGATKR